MLIQKLNEAARSLTGWNESSRDSATRSEEHWEMALEEAPAGGRLPPATRFPDGYALLPF